MAIDGKARSSLKWFTIIAVTAMQIGWARAASVTVDVGYGNSYSLNVTGGNATEDGTTITLESGGTYNFVLTATPAAGWRVVEPSPNPWMLTNRTVTGAGTVSLPTVKFQEERGAEAVVAAVPAVNVGGWVSRVVKDDHDSNEMADPYSRWSNIYGMTMGEETAEAYAADTSKSAFARAKAEVWHQWVINWPRLTQGSEADATYSWQWKEWWVGAGTPTTRVVPPCSLAGGGSEFISLTVAADIGSHATCTTAGDFSCGHQLGDSANMHYAGITGTCSFKEVSGEGSFQTEGNLKASKNPKTGVNAEGEFSAAYEYAEKVDGTGGLSGSATYAVLAGKGYAGGPSNSQYTRSAAGNAQAGGTVSCHEGGSAKFMCVSQAHSDAP